MFHRKKAEKKIGHDYRLAILGNQAFALINFRGALVREMVKRNVTVFALAPDYDDESRARVAALGAIPVASSMSRTGMNPVRDLIDMWKLARTLRALDLDATFSYFIKPVIYGTLAARLAGVPSRTAMIEGAGYVFLAGQGGSLRRTALRLLVIRLYRLALGQAKHVFMLNRDDEKLFVGSGMVAASKVSRINGIGVDLAQFSLRPLPPGQICFLLVGRLLREKGVHEYIAAARTVKQCHLGVRFILLGGVDLNPGSVSVREVEQWVDEGIIEWPGHVSDVAAWITQASVFVLPSYGEGLPRSTQEAMAMGRPIITTDVPGCRETVDEGVNGFIVAARESVGLAQAMLKFIEQPALVEAMGRQSRRLAEERFDVHSINDDILRVMEIPAQKSSFDCSVMALSAIQAVHAADEAAPGEP